MAARTATPRRSGRSSGPRPPNSTRFPAQTPRPAEFDLLDARSLIERRRLPRSCPPDGHGDRGGRRMGSAGRTPEEIPTKAEEHLQHSAHNFHPPRLGQWRKLANQDLSQREFDQFEKTRTIRHEIVRRGHGSPVPTAAGPSGPSTPAGGSTTRSKRNPTAQAAQYEPSPQVGRQGHHGVPVSGNRRPHRHHVALAWRCGTAGCIITPVRTAQRHALEHRRRFPESLITLEASGRGEKAR